MNRDEQLKQCKVCNYQKFDFQQGLVCGLTNQVAEFEGSCLLFEESSVLKEEWQASLTTDHLEQNQASTGKRFANHLLDMIFIYLFAFIFSIFLGVVAPEMLESITTESNTLTNYFYTFLFVFNYYTLLEATTGRTIGKMITNTKVVTTDGQKPNFGHVIARSLSRFIPFEAFSFLGSNESGLHDKISSTLVING